ncbi:MAG: GAF domain-containing protein, partial [Chloroflexota bacterium]
LNEVARAVSGALDLPTILADIIRLAAELVGADASSLALVDDAREQIASIHLFNFPTLFASIPVPRGRGVAWQIIESGKSLFLPDYKSHPNALPEWVEAGACAFLGVPIAVGLDRFGVLGLFSLTPGKTFTARDVSLAESVGLQAGVAIQNARLFEALNKRAAELATVAQVSIDAATKLNPDELLQKVVDLTKISFHLYHAHIYLLNDAGDTLVLTAGADEVGRRLVADGHQILLAREQSVVARAARTRRGIIVNDVSNEPLFLPNPLLPDTRSEMAVPMVVSDRLFGVFDVQANIVNRFSDEDVRIQSTLAAQVAVALQNARLFEAERRRVEALTALHETGLELSTQFDLSTLLHSIVERAVRLLEAPRGDLCLLLPDGQTLELSVGYNLPAKYVGARFKLGEGAAGLAAEIGEPVIVDDYDSWSGRAEMYNHGPFKSVLSVPVTWRGQVVGVIDVSDERISRFSAEDAELVSLFADQAAVAIANARQHEELQRRLQESDALAVISRTVNETLDLQRVLLLIVEAARRIIPNVDRAVIHLLDPDGQTLRPAAVTGVGDPVQSQIIMRPGEGIAGQVIAQGIVINVSDTHSDPRYLVAERASRTRSLLVAPVQSGPHRLGTLSVNSGKAHAFSADDERLLGTLGVQAALAIYNAQLFEDTRRQLDELLLLHTIAIAGAEATGEDELIERASRLVGETLNSVNFGVILLDETGAYLQAHSSYQNSPGAPIPLGQGITGRVAATGQPWLVQDVSTEPSYLNVDPNARSELCVPLKAGNLIFGVVNAESDRVNGFTDTDQRLLTTLAGQLATAIQKLRLYHDLEQALRQEKSARAQLVQSEKLAAMGRLVASVAHELNNPLQAIQNALYLVRQEPALGLQSMDDLQVASTEADRMAELLSRLRETYRPATGEEFRLESLNTVVDDVQRLIATHLRHNSIEFRFDPDPDMPLIPGIRDQLKQVMLNLSLNAVEAMPNGGTLTVRTRHQPAIAGDGVLLSIHDTGSGIPLDALNNIFDPFFTTKESGTGLGLTITYDIIQRHKGRIEVESEPGKGATFSIWLPVEIESELT